MKKITTALLFSAITYFSFIGVALAQGVIVPEDGSILDLAKPVYEAVAGGRYWLGAMLGLVLLTTAAKRYLPGKAGAWVNGEYGQPLTVLMLAFGVAGAAALAAGGPSAVMSLALAWAALKVAVGAAGGYTLLKQLAAPFLIKLANKSPMWAQPIFSIILWVFSKPTPENLAKKAGDAAVVAKPPVGTPNNDVTEI